MSGGTTINYVDVYNGTNISSYKNIIGSSVISGLNKGSSIIVYIESSKAYYIGYIDPGLSEIIYSSKPTVIHRVFYF